MAKINLEMSCYTPVIYNFDATIPDEMDDDEIQEALNFIQEKGLDTSMETQYPTKEIQSLLEKYDIKCSDVYTIKNSKNHELEVLFFERGNDNV